MGVIPLTAVLENWAHAHGKYFIGISSQYPIPNYCARYSAYEFRVSVHEHVYFNVFRLCKEFRRSLFLWLQFRVEPAWRHVLSLCSLLIAPCSTCWLAACLCANTEHKDARTSSTNVLALRCTELGSIYSLAYTN